jgi:nitronate monooxygenase
VETTCDLERFSLVRDSGSGHEDPVKSIFLGHAGIEVPVICGAMYPCSNPELIAAVSEAGGIGVIQPMALIYVHGHELRAGIARIRSLTSKPVGFNAIIENSSKIYLDRMRSWVDIALEEGVRFFITALGDPRWVVDRVHAVGGVVYHDVTELKWGEKALSSGVDGLICVNRRAGGHAGRQSPEALFESLSALGVPLVCAGGVGGVSEFEAALRIGYAGAQLGTRFIATNECTAHPDYKAAIVAAKEKDIVLTDKLSGVPVSVIETPTIRRLGTKAGPVARRLLRGRRTKHWMRLFYSLKSIRELKQAALKGTSYRDYFQAGKSVETIDAVVSAASFVRELADAAV